MKLEKVKLADLKTDPGNPNVMTPDQEERLGNSLRRFGCLQPIIVDENNIVLDGAHRLDELVAEGKTTTEVIRVSNLTDAEKKLLRQAMNKIHGQHDLKLDMEDLKIILADIDRNEVKSFLGDDENFVKVLEDVDGPGPDEDLLPDQAPAISKKGDLFKLGEHRIMCGDSTNKDDFNKLTGSTLVDLCITSPPYNVEIGYAEYKDKKSKDEYFNLIKKVVSNCYQSMNPGRIMAWNVGASPKTHPYTHCRTLEESGFELYREIIWQKPGTAKPLWYNSQRKPLARNYKPNYNHEIIFLASKGELILGGGAEMPDEASGDVWSIHTATATTDIPTIRSSVPNPNYHGKHRMKAHPAVFPVKLPLLIIQTMSAKGEIVLDPFGGAGTVLIAAEKTNRKAFIMEIDPHYVDLTIARWENFTGKKAVKVET